MKKFIKIALFVGCLVIFNFLYTSIIIVKADESSCSANGCTWLCKPTFCECDLDANPTCCDNLDPVCSCECPDSSSNSSENTICNTDQIFVCSNEECSGSKCKSTCWCENTNDSGENGRGSSCSVACGSDSDCPSGEVCQNAGNCDSYCYIGGSGSATIYYSCSGGSCTEDPNGSFTSDNCGGSCGGSSTDYCGDESCNGSESCNDCSEDCGVCSASSCTTPGPGANQMIGCVFNGMDLTTEYGNAPAQASASGKADNFEAINEGWGASGPNGLANNFSVRWQGTFNFSGGTYTFTTNGVDDGYRVFIDGTNIYDRWFDQCCTAQNFDYDIFAGNHTVKFEYYENAGDALTNLSWTRKTTVPNQSKCDYVSAPSSVAAGKQFNATVAMTNTGSNVWTNAAPNPYNLGSQPQDNLNWGLNRVALPSSVSTGDEVIFYFTTTAPTAPGTYDFGWKIVQDGVEWFGETCSQTISVNPSYPPTVFVDTPTEGQVITSSSFNITGWAIDNATQSETAIASVQIYIDGNYVGDATYGTDRTDVCGTYSGRPGCPNVGYNFAWNTSGYSNGDHTIKVEAIDASGDKSSVSKNIILATTRVDINAENTEIPAGTSTTINWSYSGASSCTISPIGTISGYPDGSGSVSTGNLTVSRTYIISCDGVTKSVTVNVQSPSTFLLNVIKSGQGKVVSSPSGINCGTGCSFQSYNFPTDSTVTLTATPETGRLFAGWSGACSGKGACYVLIDGEKTVYANFIADPNYKEF